MAIRGGLTRPSRAPGTFGEPSGGTCIGHWLAPLSPQLQVADAVGLTGKEGAVSSEEPGSGTRRLGQGSVPGCLRVPSLTRGPLWAVAAVDWIGFQRVELGHILVS